MFIDIKRKWIKKVLTNYIFRFLFWNDIEAFKNGDLLECEGELFIFDDSNGNSNWLKKFYPKINGFWNYIKAKEGSIYNIDNRELNSKVNSQGCSGNEYYKNSIRHATEEEKKIYENRNL